MASRSAVEWHVDAASSRALRAIAYVEVGLFGGGMLLVLCGTAFLGVTMALGGQYTYLAYLVLLALVGGPLSLFYLWPMLVDSDQRPPLSAAFGNEEMAERYAAAFSRRTLFAAVLGGALVLFAAILLDPRLAGALVVGSILLVPVASGVVSWGRVDPGEASLTHRDRTVSLSRVERVRRLDRGGIALCWLSYHPGSGDITSPRFLAASPEAAAIIEQTAAAVDPEIDAEYAPDRAVQAALGVLALCSLGVAALVFVVEPGNGGDPVLRWYIAVCFGFFGFLFALVAVFSGYRPSSS